MTFPSCSGRFGVAGILCAFFLLAGCGGSGGSSGSAGGSTNLPDDRTSPDPTSLGGTAVKGIVRNASVKVFSVEGGIVSDASIAEGSTDAAGDFDLDLPEGTAGLFLLEVVGDDDAEMRCDVPGGCGNRSEFGDFVAVGDDFRLRNIVELDAGEALDTDVSVFSELAVSDLVSSGADLTPETVSGAKTRVMDGFGLEGSLDTLRIPDLAAENFDQQTDAAQVAGLLSAALLGVALDESPEAFQTGLTTISEQWSGQGGALVVNDTDADHLAISLLDVLERASLALEDSAGSLPEQLTTVVTARVSEARQKPVGETTGGDTDGEVVAESELPRVKRFVGNLRTAITTFSDPAFGADLADRLRQVGDELAVEASDAGRVTLRVYDAVAIALQNFRADPSLTEQTIDTISVGGLAQTEDGVSFEVDQTVEAFEVQLSGTIEETLTETVKRLDTIDAETNAIELRSELELSGRVTGQLRGETASVTISSGSLSISAVQVDSSSPLLSSTDFFDDLQDGGTVEIDGQQQQLATLLDGVVFDDSESIELVEASASLEVAIEQVASAAATEPAAFEGMLSVTASDSAAEEIERRVFSRTCPEDATTTITTTGCFVYTSGTSERLGSLDLELSGALETDSATRYDLSLSTTASPSGDAPSIQLMQSRESVSLLDGAALFNLVSTGSPSGSLTVFDSEESAAAGETETDFVMIGASTLILSGPVVGLGENTRIEASGSREAFDSLQASASLSFGDVRIDLDAPTIPFDPETGEATVLPLTIVDRQGVTMTLELDLEASATDDLVLVDPGRIALNRDAGEPGQATVERRDGVLVVVYEDESFETLF
jgi:hypothetical protein